MLEGNVNAIINVLRRLMDTSWGGHTSSLLQVHSALIRQRIAYSVPILHGLSNTAEERLQRLLARSLRVCLGVPRPSSSPLVIAEAHQPPFPVMQ